MVNYWREVPTGPDPPSIIHVVIEMTKGSENKYEYDGDLGAFMLNRVLYAFFPCDYGFIPQTLDLDGDPLDLILLINQPTFTGCIATARPIGVMEMLDEGREDSKILAVSTTDPRFKSLHDVEEVQESIIKQLTYFFNHYKEPEGKQTRVLGWKGKDEAKKLILRTMERYKEET